MREVFQEKRFSSKTLKIVEVADSILGEYFEQGYKLTLRQLYYQFVARDLIENTERSYKNLGRIVNDARLAGLLDWAHIEDRTRNLHDWLAWDSPSDILAWAAGLFRLDYKEGQQYRVEVWVEKDALIDVVQQACAPYRVDHFACRGYASQSEMYSAAQRLQNGPRPVIIYLGDHDPSGIDMGRDIKDRLATFGVHDLTFQRIALTREQVDQYNPPPNPAKVTDTRYREYLALHGSQSWELDALEPAKLASLIQAAVSEYVDPGALHAVRLREAEARAQLAELAENWTGD